MNANDAMDTGPVGVKVVTFGLQGETFAIEAGRVREILDVGPITEVPNAPAFVNGLINVRGRVAPLADLRVSFGMERRAPDADSRIVVLEVEIDGEPTMIGVLADKVHDVTSLDPEALAPAPRVGMRWRAEFIRGIAQSGSDFVIVPDLERIFALHLGAASPSRSEEGVS